MKKQLIDSNYQFRSHSEISLKTLIKSETYDKRRNKYAIMLIAGDKNCGKSLLSMKVITQLCSKKQVRNKYNRIRTYIPLWFDIDTRLLTSKKCVLVYEIEQQILKQLPRYIDDPVYKISSMKYLGQHKPTKYGYEDFQVVIYLNIINDLADNVNISINDLIWFVRCKLCSHYGRNYVVILEFNSSIKYPDPPKKQALSFYNYYQQLPYEYGITSPRFACVKICNHVYENIYLFEKTLYKIFELDLYLDTNDNDGSDTMAKCRRISIPLDIIREIQKYLKSVFGYWERAKYCD